MSCLHPFCPLRSSAGSWPAVFSDPAVGANAAEQAALLAVFGTLIGLGGPPLPVPTIRRAVKRRLLDQAPCLFSQVHETVTAPGVVHLCEVTLAAHISSTNVEAAFDIQNPRNTARPFLHAPAVPGAKGGDIMEHLCSRLLENEHVPHMAMQPDGWPVWSSPAHVSLNSGKFSSLKMYGDILIPAAPHNILVSVKSEKARERFLVSGNRLESVGFGFFDEPSEFWTPSRMKLFKRWGFVAIYMPQSTLSAVEAHLTAKGTSEYAININGKPLYRPLQQFTPDIRNVAGRSTLAL